jgi:L-lysine 2,3-aminomutase
METISYRFTPSGTGGKAAVADLRQAADRFVARYGAAPFLGAEFRSLLDGGTGIDGLLKATGLGEGEFFTAVVRGLEGANHLQPADIRIAGVFLPQHFLLPLLEVLLPGEQLAAVHDVETYERLTNLRVPEEERQPLQRVIDTYPVRLSMHVIRQSRLSANVASQFMPFTDELDETGLTNTWIGQFHRGLLEQMYQNRPIFVLHMSCPVYCRFCFRKHKDMRNQPAPTVDDVQESLRYIEQSPRIKEIVLTGGEPLLNRKTLTAAVEGLEEIPQIQTIRIASRCVSYYPHLFYADGRFWLDYLIETNRRFQQKGKRIELATHFIHPDEVSPASLEIISTLVSSGVGVYTQTPFLKGCNDGGPELAELYRQLRGAGSELHYIYIPCSPIRGNRSYWAPLSEGHRVAAHLRAHLSDRAMPILCTATKIGKIDWNASGWAVERDGEDPRYLWIRTPFTEEYYRQFGAHGEVEGTRGNGEGTLDARFMADIGDEQLFLGPFAEEPQPPVPFSRSRLRAAQEAILRDQRIPQGIVAAGIPGLWRIHETRVEADAGDADSFRKQIEYVSSDPAITDVVLSARAGLLPCLEQVEHWAAELEGIPHINALRLRSLGFAYSPEEYDEETVKRIAGLNRLRAADPLRVELETQFIHSEEFSQHHAGLIARFLSRGVTVYNNILLLSGINDDAEEMKRICYSCRQIGIELYNLYVAGLPVQEELNADYPVDASRIIRIATELRRHQSGREIPLYTVRTLLGDADFNLNALFTGDNSFPRDGGFPGDGGSTGGGSSSENGGTRGPAYLRLPSYGLEYFRRLDPAYRWPQGVRTDSDGSPVVPVAGLAVRTNRDFFLRS